MLSVEIVLRLAYTLLAIAGPLIAMNAIETYDGASFICGLLIGAAVMLLAWISHVVGRRELDR